MGGRAQPLADEPLGETAAEASARLVRLAQTGDRAAFAELYARYGRMVHGVILARVTRLDVEDLVHDVFVTAMERLGELRDAAAFGGWLRTIAQHQATDHLRRAGRRADAVLPPARAGGFDPTEVIAVLSAIRELPDAYRETLTLRFVEGMTGPEIAATTGLAEGSVRVNLHRGMAQLRGRLDRRPT